MTCSGKLSRDIKTIPVAPPFSQREVAKPTGGGLDGGFVYLFFLTRFIY